MQKQIITLGLDHILDLLVKRGAKSDITIHVNNQTFTSYYVVMANLHLLFAHEFGIFFATCFFCRQASEFASDQTASNSCCLYLYLDKESNSLIYHTYHGTHTLVWRYEKPSDHRHEKSDNQVVRNLELILSTFFSYTTERTFHHPSLLLCRICIEIFWSIVAGWLAHA